MFYLHDEPQRLRFALTARLDQESMRDLEASYRTAESIRMGRAMVVDTRRLVDLDEPTRALLDRLKAAGATVIEPDVAERRPGIPRSGIALQSFTSQGATRFLRAALTQMRRLCNG